MYVLTVRLKSGRSLTFEGPYLEVLILTIEAIYQSSLESWAATRK